MFRRMIKWIGWTVLGFGGLIAMGLLFVLIRFPREIPVEDLVIEPSPERVERGRYLVNNVAFCMNCHAERDWGSMSGQIVPGTEGKGAMQNIFGDGPVYAANITPHALGDWSDGQIKRALTSGLNAEAKPLHPNMPYFTYADMSEEDVHAVVAYLRTLKPIEHDPPRAAPSPLISLVARILPKPYTPKPPPNPEDSVAVGRYLTQLAGCQDCHRSDFFGRTGPLFSRRRNRSVHEPYADAEYADRGLEPGRFYRRVQIIQRRTNAEHACGGSRYELRHALGPVFRHDRIGSRRYLRLSADLSARPREKGKKTLILKVWGVDEGKSLFGWRRTTMFRK